MDFVQVKQAVEQRMRALGLTKTALARKANIDRGLVAKIVSGCPWSMRPATLGRIEAALGWPGGAIEEVGRGGDAPTSEGVADEAGRLDAIDGRLGRIEGLLEQLVDERAAR